MNNNNNNSNNNNNNSNNKSHNGIANNGKISKTNLKKNKKKMKKNKNNFKINTKRSNNLTKIIILNLHCSKNKLLMTIIPTPKASLNHKLTKINNSTAIPNKATIMSIIIHHHVK